MGRISLLAWIGASALATTMASGQLDNNAPAQTIPDAPESDAEEAADNQLITPSLILPKGFSFRSDGYEGITGQLSGGLIQMTAVGNVHVVTDQGDTITSDRAILDFSENAQSLVTFLQNVRLRSTDGIEVLANRATFNEGTKSLLFEGDVSAYQGTALHRGDSALYYYEMQRLVTSNLRTSFAPFLLEADEFQAVESDDGKYYQGRNAGVTTDDVAEPSFWLRGEEITVVPGDRVRFRNLKFYAGDTPVFWLPYLSQKFDGEFSYRPTPGARSNWGLYLLNAYSQDIGGIRDPETGIVADPTFETTGHFDLYSKRGLGLGLDLDSYHWKSNPNLGELSLYYLYDLDPSERRSGQRRLGFNDPQRYRVQLRQRTEADLLPGATGHADINTTLLSDRFFQEDFRPSDYTTNFQPDNTLSLSQQWEESQLLTAWARFRPNDFYRTDQRLPEVAFDQIRRPLFGSPILHESQNIAGYYREERSEFNGDRLRTAAPIRDSPFLQNELGTMLGEPGFARFHTYHELSLPLNLENGLHLIPRLGAGNTSYQNIRGPLDSENRSLFHASIDASLKFTKRYPDWFMRSWGLDSALHVVQPYATATYLETSQIDRNFLPLDRLTPSTRPRAIHPGRFAAIDDFTDWEFLRLGVRNRLLTKRDEASHQWLSVDTYIDVFTQDPEFDRDVSNLYTDVHWSPLPWLDLTVETQLPFFSNSNFTEVATGLQVMPNEDTQLRIRHRYLESHPILRDSNRLEFEGYHRINEEWGVRATQRWEFEENTLEYQQYSIHRNLGAWAFTA
jgi:LPS-assembly protein